MSTHLLDTSIGRPAAQVPVGLHTVADDGSTRLVGGGVTDNDGRVATLADGALAPGTFRLVYDTVGYFTAVHRKLFYPRIIVEVYLDGARAHYHVPVLASTYSYSTYLGS
ncbi:hydroxyisourate hydrolase [Nakamurella sp. YIM 132087]|uniref:5-hydroxyisourate hydrolase n=1 Tax=Nakamurella alba TaxID=2665158 RepID=A0A7K1FN43_9ACTN|nr:hydroxyisourate hydrolase [Nakamurella alba]